MFFQNAALNVIYSFNFYRCFEKIGGNMKKIFVWVFAAVFMSANSALADSIAGKLGITGRAGTSYVYESEFTHADIEGWSTNRKINTEFGFFGGGGLVFGIKDNVAVYFDVTWSEFGVKAFPEGQGEQRIGTVEMLDLSLGGQWRFMPKNSFVPYIGFGLDMMINKFRLDDAYNDGSDWKADYAYGGHLSVGADYFVTPYMALNAEIRGTYGGTCNITRKHPGETDVVAMAYNPTNIAGFVGLKFFVELKNRFD